MVSTRSCPEHVGLRPPALGQISSSSSFWALAAKLRRVFCSAQPLCTPITRFDELVLLLGGGAGLLGFDPLRLRPSAPAGR